MNILAELKDGFSIHQPMADKPWKRCNVVAATMAADERPYAIIITDGGEFEFVPWFMLKPEEKNDRTE
jgi:hypothetical protein